jgi:hypothetical protein
VNPETICFRQTNTSGYFAQLTDCVLLSKACLDKGVEPYFFIDNPISSQSGLARNALYYYFFQTNLTPASQKDCYQRVLAGDCLTIRNRYCINEFWSGDPRREVANTIRTIGEGAVLFHRNLAVREWVHRIVQKFWAQHFGSQRVLGVHFRGGDKFDEEAEPISFDEVDETVRSLVCEFDRIFVATDDPSFFEKAKTSSWAPLVTWYRVPDRLILHYLDTRRNFRKGAQAVIDSLLLSRCNLLVKTPSLLSAWSKVFNPDIEVVTIGRPRLGAYGDISHEGHGYWPEKCLHSIPLQGDHEGSSRGDVAELC